MIASRFARIALLALSLSVVQAWAQAPAAPVPYKLDPARSTLTFNFTQAGADSKGNFNKYNVALALSDRNLAASKLDVTVEVPSLNTDDKERDDTLRSADLFSASKFPRASFVASKITRLGPGNYEASGKLTIRDVTRDVRIPFALQPGSDAGQRIATMTGKFTIKRLDYGIGQGEWKSTEWVANDVVVGFNLRLIAPPG